jgi:hypothetical protein
LRDLGVFVLRGFPDGTRLFQVRAPGLDDDFPAPRDTVRAGGARMSIWFRDPSASRPEPPAAVALDFETIAGEPLGDATEVEILPAARSAPGVFRLLVRRHGHAEEEYDGLTVDGPTDAPTVVNAHSRLIRIVRRAAADEHRPELDERCRNHGVAADGRGVSKGP